jgi:probable HAF family extracellular repeat protein
MRTTLLFVTSGLAIAFGAPASAAVLYKAVDLGGLGDHGAEATGINDLGQVVGWSWIQYGITGHPFRTAPNQPINPATDDLGANGYPYGINNLGQVVGGVNASGHGHPFRTGPNQPINPATDDLGTLGGDEAYACAINGRGEVVGDSMMPDNEHGHGFRTRPGLPIDPAIDDLVTLGGPSSSARAINSLGQVAGSAERADSFQHAFRTAPGKAINPATDDLGTLGGNTSAAGAINDLGQVAGYSYKLDPGVCHVFRTAPNRPIDPATDDLGALYNSTPTVRDMNNRGDIVGDLLTPDDEMRAFAVLGSTMYDLNDLVEGKLNLQEAHGINNAGQIVANGDDGRAYRLDPIPEPSTSLLLSAGVLGLLVLNWRRLSA